MAAVLLMGGLGCGYAQSVGQGATEGQGTAPDSRAVVGLKIREMHPADVRTPFPFGSPTGSASKLEFLAAAEMSAEDRALAESSQAEIVRRARLQGLVYGAGSGWGYEQAVCPAFPGHLVLEYSRRSGAGDVSLFAAVVPRGSGHVRVIPVSRRGFTLFTLAGENTLTIHDFNAIVAEEKLGLDADWLSLGLCYAALAGGHARSGLVAEGSAQERYPLIEPSMLKVSYRKPGAVVLLSNAEAPKGGRSLALRFSARGHLEQVKLVTPGVLSFRAVPSAPTEERGKPVAGNVIELPK